MIKIHILGKSGTDLNVALYYPVPDHLYDDSAVDPGRTPASDKLTTEEVNDLKLGKIFEVLASINSSGKVEAAAKAELVAYYNTNKNAFLQEYTRLYSGYIGEAWDGSGWS